MNFESNPTRNMSIKEQSVKVLDWMWENISEPE